MTVLDAAELGFGPFRVLPGQRLLLQDGKPVRIGGRALDILLALLERPGEPLGKADLIGRVWPGIFVDEGNLKFQISALRRALGDGLAGARYILSIPGRGYSFVAPVGPVGARRPPAPVAATPHNLPHALTRLLGRRDIIDQLAERLPRLRFLSIIGPGGIGKTSVALAVAEAVLATYEQGVWFVDLAPLVDPHLVPSAVATVLGYELRLDDPLVGLVASLQGDRRLLVLDNCEHVIDAAAALANAVLRGARGVDILVTSREPLRAEGERVHRLASLPSPPTAIGLTAEEALDYAAIELFVERAVASQWEFVLSDADAPLVADICRKLDGVPLAIELAAARVSALGVPGLAAQLDGRFHLLTNGQRTAPPRHRTLRATLDWSYDLLSTFERAVLGRVAAFQGTFTLDAAIAVTSLGEMTEADIVNGVAGLVAKSLLIAVFGETTVRYRLLETIRAYALEKLIESGERNAVMRRHAEYYRALLERATAEAVNQPIGEWLAAYRPCIDDLHAALTWGLSPNGDARIAIALAAASVPLWVNLSMLAECREFVERALASLDGLSDCDPRCEMQLHAALGLSLTYTSGPIPAARAAWTRALNIARGIGDAEHQLRALRGLWVIHLNSCQYRQALALAHEFAVLAAATADPAELDLADQMVAVLLHCLSDHANARLYIERQLARPPETVRTVVSAQSVRFRPNQRIMAQCLLARILWLQGFPEQADRITRRVLDEAKEIRHSLSLCHALGEAACPIAIFIGDLAAADVFAATLLDTAKGIGLSRWISRGRSFQAVVLVKRGDFAAGLPMLRDSLAEMAAAGAAPGYSNFLAVLASGYGRSGRIAEALATIEQALQHCEHHEERWCLPDVLRIKGELYALGRSSDAERVAEDCFRHALDCARRDGTLSWELRSATSLARLYRDRGRRAEALDVLAPIRDRFTEGWATTDLRNAELLLRELA